MLGDNEDGRVKVEVGNYSAEEYPDSSPPPEDDKSSSLDKSSSAEGTVSTTPAEYPMTSPPDDVKSSLGKSSSSAEGTVPSSDLRWCSSCSKKKHPSDFPSGKATCVVCLPKRRKLSSEARARSHEIEELRISNENLERQQEALKFYSAQQDQEIAVLKQQCYLLLELSRTQVQYTTAIDPSAANRELNMITRETWQTMMNQAGNGAGSVPAPLTLPEQRVASFSTVLQPPVSVTSDAIENSDCNMARGVKRLHDDVGESFGIDHGEGLGYADSMLDSPWEDMELPDSLFPENFHNADDAEVAKASVAPLGMVTFNEAQNIPDSVYKLGSDNQFGTGSSGGCIWSPGCLLDPDKMITFMHGGEMGRSDMFQNMQTKSRIDLCMLASGSLTIVILPKAYQMGIWEKTRASSDHFADTDLFWMTSALITLLIFILCICGRKTLANCHTTVYYLNLGFWVLVTSFSYALDIQRFSESPLKLTNLLYFGMWYAQVGNFMAFTSVPPVMIGGIMLGYSVIVLTSPEATLHIKFASCLTGVFSSASATKIFFAKREAVRVELQRRKDGCEYCIAKNFSNKMAKQMEEAKTESQLEVTEADKPHVTLHVLPVRRAVSTRSEVGTEADSDNR